MTERELRRTALIIPPRGRAVLCCWAAIPGLLAAPFVFWQSMPAGMVFCLLWAALVAVVYQRACSYAAALGAETLTVYSGIVFPLRRAVRRRARNRAVPAAHAAAPAGRGIGGRHHGTGHAAYFTGGPGRAGRCPHPCPCGGDPMNERRLHPFTVLLFLRKTLVVYLLPLVQVLFERNWTALHTALRQDALLFLLLCAVSWGILRVSSWSMDDTGVFHLHWRLGIRLDRALRGEMLAALIIDRPLLYRMAGASRLTLYPVGAAQKHTLSVCLPKADAEAVADQLMPLVKPALHRPAGGERAALGFLGANGLSTLALFVLAVRQTRDVPDWNPAVFAQIQVSFLARFAARWLPAGAAWLLAAAGFLLGASLMRSFAQTVHYTVWHTADQIGSRGGWLGHFECRVRTSEISFADVRISPAARLMKRWPVFVTAGGCSPELPLFVYRSGEEALFRELLPEFRMPPDLLARTEQRSLIFFAPAGIPFALCLLLTLVSATVLPQLTVTLLIPTLFFGALLAGAAAGYRREGLWLREGRMTLRRQQGLYLHCICVFHPDVCLTAAQSPWAASVGRTNLTLTFPGWVKLKVRSVPLRDAEKFFRFMETN